MSPQSVTSRSHICVEASKAELWFQYSATRIARAVAKNHWLEAREIACEWAAVISDRLGLSSAGVWKLFKRALAAKWFGRVESQKFLPGWSVEEALTYARRFPGRAVRFSLFPRDIACHAVSARLPEDSPKQWEQILIQVNKETAMEMFPEASTPKGICFRRYGSCFEDSVIYEAGKGQAMFVFEQEQGRHPIVSANRITGSYTYTRIVPSGCSEDIGEQIEAQLQSLIALNDMALCSKVFGICRSLGIEYISVEGYYNRDFPDTVTVVDLDLPFDYVFMAVSRI